MNELIIGLIVLLLVAIGIYVVRAEKIRRQADEDTRNPWTKR